MYTKSRLYTSGGDNTSPERYIESIDGVFDIANSTLLYKLDNESVLDSYTITKYENRIDLIAREIYGNEKYSWILLYINRVSIDDLVRGTELKYIPLSTLQNILRNS